MSVKITGLNLLNANVYDRILITERNSDYRVYIQKNNPQKKEVFSRFKGTPIGYKISEELNNKTDEQKIIIITKKFLEYARINKISKDYISYNKIYDVASGSREFRMQIFNSNLKVISQMVIYKYLNDRLKFICENQNINSMTVSLEEHSSYIKSPYHISLELLKQDGKIVDFEKDFLEDLIYTKLNEIGEYATVEPRIYLTKTFLDTEELMPYVLRCGNLIINIVNDRYLLKEIKKIVDNYNINLHKQKTLHMDMQMKMEGF